MEKRLGMGHNLCHLVRSKLLSRRKGILCIESCINILFQFIHILDTAKRFLSIGSWYLIAREMQFIV